MLTTAEVKNLKVILALDANEAASDLGRRRAKYLLAQAELVNKLNVNLTGLWKWLIHEATAEEILAIPVDLTPGSDVRELPISPGAQLLVKHWTNTNPFSECWAVGKWSNKPGQWTANTRQRVAHDVQFVKHWRFMPISYRAIGTYFVDPPYQFNSFRYGRPDFDYSKLVANLARISIVSEIIACEADCPKTGKRPTYLPFQEFRRTVTSRRKANEHHHSHEVMWHKIPGEHGGIPTELETP